AELADAIETAAREVVDGRHDGDFVLDVFQTGSATSTNMNMNEVLANRAAELLGQPRGGRAVHPNDHVNLGQSSNDTMPSAVQIALLERGTHRLLPAWGALVARLHDLADTNWDELRDGRTHLMRAAPIRLGQRLRGYADQLAAAGASLGDALARCRALPLGGTAVGTGIGCPPGFAAEVCAELRRDTGLEVHETAHHLGVQGGFDAVAGLVASVRVSGSVLYKITNDLRWQASDALRELEIPVLQPGSSIMPGKVNPVVCEAVLMCCAQIVGNDAAVGFANSQGQFELHTMIPLVARNALEAVELLAAAAGALDTHCLTGLRPAAGAAARVDANPILATGLAPVLGYDVAAELAHAAEQSGRTVLEIARERTDLEPDRLTELLDPRRLAGELGAERS
ncbi:MAG: aspartate ammonia-lyase, partial [Planctomycetes bacterium]|nr:aspartate ammonia-lyase [Planctomycetota bacterium]